MSREQNIRALQAIAEKVGCEARVFPGGSSVAFSNREIPATVKVEISEDGLIYPYIYVRTNSFDLPGERTDANEILSVLVAAFLRVNNYASCRILDIPHPAIEAPTEIYARYLVPDQSQILAVQLDDQSLDRLEEFCFAIRFLGLMLPNLWDWDTTKPTTAHYSNYSYQEAEEWAETVANIVGERFNNKIQFCQRINPCWQHYRSIQTRLTVYYSPQISSSLISWLADNKTWKNISISTGNIYDSGDIINFISLRECRFVEKF